jgi:murein DD-endopeptidase MepM/ murein hydrolase activator NlpD
MVALLICSCVCAATAATVKTKAASTRRDLPAVTHECTNGVRLRLNSPEAAQGTLLLVEVDSASPVADVTANWGRRAVPFWQDEANSKEHRAIIGIDLEHPAGKYNVDVTTRLANGETVHCGGSVLVTAGRFAVERLRVAPKFVEPNPQDLARATKDRELTHTLLSRVTPERMWHGEFRFPLDGPRTGRNFGKRRILNGQLRAPHTGLDIPAPTGTPVHAPQAGRVVMAQDLFFSGNTILLDHGLGVYTLYGHLSSMAVRPDDLVTAGSVIGRVGATGRVTGPHLHWGLIVNQSTINPLAIVGTIQ